MRVIAGRAKGRRLKSPPARTRPTSDLLRGAIFDVLDSFGADYTRALDIYAGSGALGIEALSRGGERCDFVESDHAACAVIRDNLRLTGFEDRARVFPLPVARALQHLQGPHQTAEKASSSSPPPSPRLRMESGGHSQAPDPSTPLRSLRAGSAAPPLWTPGFSAACYTLVLADPPYADAEALPLLREIAVSSLVDADTVIVLEHSSGGEPPGDLGSLSLIKTRRHGDSAFSVYARR